jgi:DnaJ homolog subfamily C member 17
MVPGGEAKDVHTDALTTLFSAFGKIANAFFLKDKRQRIGEKREKKIVATGVIVFASIVSAHAAVVDSEKKKKSGAGLWSIIESVSWASGSDPNIEHSQQTPPLINDKLSVPRTSGSATKRDIFDFLSLKSNSIKSATGRPSFASFSSATSGMSSTVNGGENDSKSLSTPSLEEVTLMHLKTAQREKERKALEEQLRKEDEAADTATAPQLKESF